MTAFAAGWTTGQGENSGQWWYDLGDGSFYAGSQAGPSWQWLDGNLFEIQPADPYPSSYSATTERTEKEISAGTLPDLRAYVEKFSDYDIVFIGYPKMEYDFNCV